MACVVQMALITKRLQQGAVNTASAVRSPAHGLECHIRRALRVRVGCAQRRSHVGGDGPVRLGVAAQVQT